MKIIHVISSMGLGGAETVATELAVQHARAHDVTVLTVSAAKPEDAAIAQARRDRLLGAGVEIVEGASLSKLSMLLCARKLWRMIRHGRVDIVHSHTDIPDFVVSLVRRSISFPLVRTIHNTSLWETHPMLARITETGFNEDLVVGINRVTLEAYQQLRRDVGRPQTSFQKIVPNGIEEWTEDRYLERGAARQALGADPSALVFGFIGRLEPQKGIDLLLQATAAIPAVPEKRHELHVIGDGSLKNLVADACKRSPATIHAHGNMVSPRRFMKAFDYLVIPSRFEGMPLVAVEALMSDLPMIVSDIPELTGIVGNKWPLQFRSEQLAQLTDLLAQICDETPEIPAATGAERGAYSSTGMARAYLSAYLEHAARAR